MPKTKPPLSAREVFARNLRRARRMKDLSQEALALEAGVTRAYLSRVERAVVNVSIDNLEALAKAVRVPLCDLIDPAQFPDLDDAA
jgi:transcriptional regulator with XRE-family HTH domain